MGKDRRTEAAAVSRLAQINVDTLCYIFSYLDLPSLARLSQTCLSLHVLIEQYGWRAIALQRQTCTDRREIISSSQSKMSYKYLLQIDLAWSSKTFRSYQCSLPSIKTTSSGRADRHQPQSLLLLTPLALLLFTGCEMRLWTRSQLRKVEPMDLKQAHLFHLINPAGSGMTSTSSALWDICCCTQLDSLGHYVAVGRLNGLVEIIHISKGTLYSDEWDSSMQVNLVWLCKPASSDEATSNIVQSMHACPSSGLFTIAYKDGHVRLYKLYLHKIKFNIAMISTWKLDGRPWSIWIEKDLWLAIGTNSHEPIIVYSLLKSTHQPTESIRLSTGDSHKMTSVYALQSQVRNGVTCLLAGCYDGTLRLYDIDTALKNHNVRFEKDSLCFQPVRQLRDRFDPSAIYCLCNGVGSGSSQVAAGTSRYGVCKFFQLDDSASAMRNADDERKSWSTFAAYPSQSPTYSLVGQFDRLFGVTDAVLWQIDTRDAYTFSTRKNINCNQRQTIAFYRHGDMILERSRWPIE